MVREEKTRQCEGERKRGREGSSTLDAARILLSEEYSNLLLRQVCCYLITEIIDENS